MPSRRSGYAGWKVENTSVEEAPPATSGTAIAGAARPNESKATKFPEPRALPAGFVKVVQVSRTLPGHDRPVMQSVYSDGMATLSVFVDPDGARIAGHEGSSQRGALSVVTRAFGDRAVIAVGELPTAALRRVAESVGPAPR
jgi:sigma-E factor negative regulatory protein RseB